MNNVAYISGSLLLSISEESSFGLNEKRLKKALSESVGKVKEYLAFKERLDEEERQSDISQPCTSLSDIRKAIRSREAKITHFIETLTDDQITLLYLLFQVGSDIQTGIVKRSDDVCKQLSRYIDSDFNFSHTNNRQFKLSYFHDYLFTRSDAARNVIAALNTFRIETIKQQLEELTF